jgi:hypothetical protein
METNLASIAKIKSNTASWELVAQKLAVQMKTAPRQTTVQALMNALLATIAQILAKRAILVNWTLLARRINVIPLILHLVTEIFINSVFVVHASKFHAPVTLNVKNILHSAKQMVNAFTIQTSVTVMILLPAMDSTIIVKMVPV